MRPLGGEAQGPHMDPHSGTPTLGPLEVRCLVSGTGDHACLWFKPLSSGLCIAAAEGHRSERGSGKMLTWEGPADRQAQDTCPQPAGSREPSAVGRRGWS